MKQHRRRKSIQRRIAGAPSPWELDRAFCSGYRWTKKDLRAMAAKPAPRLEFNQIHMIGPETIVRRTIGPTDDPNVFQIIEYHATVAPEFKASAATLPPP